MKDEPEITMPDFDTWAENITRGAISPNLYFTRFLAQELKSAFVQGESYGVFKGYNAGYTRGHNEGFIKGQDAGQILRNLTDIVEGK